VNHRLQGIGMTSRRTRENMTRRLKQQGISNNKILMAMNNIPRHIFVDEALASRSYEDTALPIGYNQTISQPYIVARMTELLLADKKLSRVLEIGTGCGYQTALLSRFVDQVYSVERIAPLLKKAKDYLWDLKFKNIKFQHSDGGWGWLEEAPFDGIIVTAAPAEIPDVLLQQMALGGVMIIPIGTDQQELHKIIRTKSSYQDEAIESVSFVPFLEGKV
jgi:protein-L-isoaspartate(D-aspartate) O-methyltransferase